MVLGKTAPQNRGVYPTSFSRPRFVIEENEKEKSSRKSKSYQIPEQCLLRSEERLTGRQMGDGPINTQYIYKVPKIQNAHYERGKTTTSKVFLVSIPRFKRRILARSGNKTEKTIFGLHVQRPKMAVQSYAVRSKYRTQDIFKIDRSCGQKNGQRRNMVFTISRRSLDSGTHKRRMSRPSRQGHGNPQGIWVDYKSAKIAHPTRTSFRVARSKLRSQSTYSQLNSVPYGRSKATVNSSHKIKVLLPQEDHETPRCDQLDWPDQYDSPLTVDKNKDYTQSVQKKKTGCSHSSDKRNETQYGQMDQNTPDPTTTGKCITYNHNSDRCIIEGLGLPNQPRNLPRSVRSLNEQMVNKRIGTTHNMVRVTHGEKKEPSYSGTMRQLDSSSGCQTQHINSIPALNDYRTDMEESNFHGMDTNSITHTGQVQYNCRPAEQESGTVNRMVITRQRIQKYTKNKSKTTGGSVCYSSEPQTGNVCFPMPRSEGNSSGCHVNTMEQLGSSLSLPSVIHDFEGFEQTDRNQIQECNTDHSRDAMQTMVHGSEITTNTFIYNESTSTTDSSEQNGEGTQPDQTSRMAVIEAGYKKQYPDCPAEGITLMAAPVRKVSTNEYQRKWKVFMTFLRLRNIPFKNISVTKVIQFLCFLFYERNLSPSTVAHYRTALVVPLLVYFNIDLKVPALRDLLRAMCLQRPKTPSAAPAWSLNKVLKFLENLPSNISQEMLLRKTAFLLLLATGWRVSELHACVRDHEFCFFNENSVLHIRPHPSFLAKNERSQDRWEHKEIKMLKLQNGSISKICPVSNLKRYLQKTKKFNKGKLFLHPGNHQKTMTIYSLSKYICEVILMADPATKAKVHDVRKYASACSYANNMLTGDLVQAMNWSSPVTFFRFYFCQTEPLETQVVLPMLNGTDQR